MMTFLNIFPGFSSILIVAGLSVAICFLAILRSLTATRNWETRKLADTQHISLEVARSVVKGLITLDDLDVQAWKLAEQYGLDFQTACKVRDGELDVRKYLAQQREAYLLRQVTSPKTEDIFPFKIKPARAGLRYFDIQEMCSEPDAYVNASLANAWIYTDGQEITHLVLSGHANGPVCSQLTALLMNTYLSMDSSEETLIVPGACMLRGPAGASHLLIKSPQPRTNVPFPITQLFQQAPSPLQRVPGDLEPFQNDIGLIRTHLVEGATYWQVYNGFVAQIRAHHRPNQNILLRHKSTGETTKTLFLPFLSLTDNQLRPVEFELPLSLFQSEDFDYLKDVHQRALLLELTDDAMRRKRIYEEWLRKDERDYKEYAHYYAQLPPERRQAKDVLIGGSRDYLSATIQKAAVDGKEVYISPQEHYEKNLPGLLEADKYWIVQMEKLISDFNKRDKSRDERLEEINIATLIDSFLRGWASVFLSREKGRDSYEKWCAEKRLGVWRVIHRRLETQKMRLEPLLEENTIFQIQLIDRATLRLTPLHLVTDQDLLIYLSPCYGMTYYVNIWSRRELIYAPVVAGKSNLALSKENYQQGVALLDLETSLQQSSIEQNVRRGITKINVALKYQPLYAAQQIWNDWWARFARDTSSDFEIFSNLMRGIQAHQDDDYVTSSFHLKKFVELFPNHLPDPYILLALQELQSEFGIVSALQARRSKIKTRNEVLESHTRKLEYLRSNQELVDKLSHPGFASGRGDKQRVADVLRIYLEVQDLKTQLDSLKTEIDGLNDKISKTFDEIWIEMPSHRYVHKARELNSDYVEKILERRQVDLSGIYWARFRPLHEILLSDEYIYIAESLYRASQDLGDGKATVDQLKGIADECLNTKYIQKTDLNSLEEFRNKLDSVVEMDSIVRELMLRKEMEQIAQSYFQKGLFQYEQSAYLLPEFTEPIKRLIALYARYRLQYRKSLLRMVNANVPLRNFAPRGRFVVLDRGNFKPSEVGFDQEKGLIWCRDVDGRWVSLAKAEGLTDEESAHLEQEIRRPDFLHRPMLGMSTSERILNCSIALSPQAKRWGQIIQDLESELLRVVAYSHRAPIPNEPLPGDEIMKAFEGHPAVDGVQCDLDLAQSKFLNEIGVQLEDVKVIDI